MDGVGSGSVVMNYPNMSVNCMSVPTMSGVAIETKKSTVMNN